MDSGFVPAESVTLRDQLAVLGRRWRVIVLVTLLGVLASGIYIQTKAAQYTSHAEVQVRQVTSNQFAGNQTPIANSVSMPTEQRIATSATVADALLRSSAPGHTGQQALSHLDVTVPATTQILDFTYSAAGPKALRRPALRRSPPRISPTARPPMSRRSTPSARSSTPSWRS